MAVCAKRDYTEQEANEFVNKDTLKLLNGKKMRRPNRSAYYCHACKSWHITTMIASLPFLKINKPAIKTTPESKPVCAHKKTSTIVVKVPTEIKDSIQILADMDNRTLSNYIRKMFIELVENHKTE